MNVLLLITGRSNHKIYPKRQNSMVSVDTEDSEYVKQIKANGNKVIVTHIIK